MGLVCLSGTILSAIPQRVAGECPDTLTIELSTCLEVGSELVAPIALSNASESIVAGQFFMEYSTAVFEVISVTPGDWPFVFPILPDPGKPGLIDFAVGVLPGGCGTMEDTVMAYITLLVIGDQAGTPFIRFRPHEPTTRLVGKGGTVVPPVTIDAGEAEGIDLANIADFQNCFGGDGVEVQAECACRFDIDEDLDVDLADYQALVPNMEGPISWYCENP